ncbi:Tim10/DDP family zinc finger protein [Xylariaceae sp. FL0255]|nr:Tim10/DDP family zinc finger protein [Xylariaceae sp. FL0255]
MDNNFQLNDADIERMSDKDKTDLRQFLHNESQKARVQTSVHSMTDMCFRKCITSTIRSGTLDKGEESCMKNCVARFMDISTLAIQNLQNSSRH